MTRNDESEPGDDGLLADFGPGPEEPEEFDPHSLGPDVPSAPDTSANESEASAGLIKAFWSAVLFANVGLLGVSLGPMLYYFTDMTDAAVVSFLVGILGLTFAYRRYHDYVHGDDDSADGDATGGD